MKIGFNPSFTGIALVARVFQNDVEGVPRFQSFFYWNCLGGQDVTTPRRYSGRVSILLLLELPWWL